MSYGGEVGEIRETFDGVFRVEWQIPDFLCLPEEYFYTSPVFYFSDSCWYLTIDPNTMAGEPASSPKWVAPFLGRKDSGSAKKIKYSLGIKTSNGVVEKASDYRVTVVGTGYDNCVGIHNWITRDNLLDEKFTPLGLFTVSCKLSGHVPHSTSTSLFSRVWKVSRDLKKKLDEGKDTDIVLKLKDKEIGAHRAILAGRCEYFAGMFRHEFEENTSGVGNIDDIEEGIFRNILSYLYCGEVEQMTPKNVCEIYIAADKLLLKELKRLCASYMEDNLSTAVVCDILELAEKYEEKKLKECATSFLAKNAPDILQSDKWKTFKEGHIVLASEILEAAIQKRF